MAIAKVNSLGISVTLTLSEDEARTLRVILQKVGGCPISSLRAHSDSVLKALQGAGVREPGCYVGDQRYGEGGTRLTADGGHALYFLDNTLRALRDE